MTKRRVAFLNTHPIQYFAPLYAYLNAAPDLSITALYLSDYSIRGAHDREFGHVVQWDIDLLAGYDAWFVDGAGHREEARGYFSMVAPAVWRDVRRGGFDALVVHGHTPAAVLIAIAAARVSGIPVFTRGETHLGLACPPIKRALRRPLMRTLYSQFAGALAIGSANQAYYQAMGVPERRIFLLPYAVDNARFMSAAELDPIERVATRRRLGVEDDRPIILSAAKFSRKKRPDDLIRAAAVLASSDAAFHLVIVGSGEMEDELKTLARSLGLDNVRFPGFVNQGDLPAVYAVSDIFVLPSDNEPWGLAVNEAMCAGLPVVLSAEVGCVADLVDDGVNGLLFPAGEVAALAGALRPLVADARLRRRMGDAGREIISRWSYAECLAGLRAALASLAE